MSQKKKISTPVAHLCIDVEATGQSSMLNSMIQIGVVDLDGPEFYAELRPLPDKVIQRQAIDAIGLSYEMIMQYGDAENAMKSFVQWLDATYKGRRPVMWSDNPAFDWQFVNGYLHTFAGCNPLGHSARRIGDLYAGLHGDPRKTNQWKRLRDTKHSHNALDDARGNAEALRKILAMAKTGEIY